MSTETIPLAQYLVERLVQLGVKAVHGVPGDFNLGLLDFIEDDERLYWVGNCNELNAAYASDGYSRVKQQIQDLGVRTPGRGDSGVKGLGVICTTFGVGELSALNGIAGCMSERVPVLHIVGVPSLVLQNGKKMLHHTLGDGNFNIFAKAAEGVSAAQALLTTIDGATDEIDRVLRVALETAKPTYLTFPTDLVHSPVSRSKLDTPITPEVIEEKRDLVRFVVNDINRLWTAAKNPIVIIDACAARYGVEELALNFIKSTGVTFFSTPMSKAVLPETSEQFGGVYIGEISTPQVKARVDAADLTIYIGAIKSDFNSGGFTNEAPIEQSIELHSDHTTIQYAKYPVSFHQLLPELITTLKHKSPPAAHRDAGLQHVIPDGDAGKMVSQAAFWPLVGSFLQKDDIVITETGTSSFGILDSAFPTGSMLLSQVLWGSIGWSVGACLGAALAAKESQSKRRTILFVGDGSLQLTVQEIATMIRHKLAPIIVVLNNDGYTIERFIHGETKVYNDISGWKWQELLSFFNAGEAPIKSWLANTRGELIDILGNKEFAAADKIQLLEVKMDKMDAPRALIAQAQASAKLNA